MKNLLLLFLLIGTHASAQLPMYEPEHEIAISMWLIPQLHLDLENPVKASYYTFDTDSNSIFLTIRKHLFTDIPAPIQQIDSIDPRITTILKDLNTSEFSYNTRVIPFDSLSLLLIHEFGYSMDTTNAIKDTSYDNNWYILNNAKTLTNNETVELSQFSFGAFFPIETEKYYILQTGNIVPTTQNYTENYLLVFRKPEEGY